MSHTAIYLDAEDTQGKAEMPDFIDIVEKAYRDRGNGAPAKPRTLLSNKEPPGFITGYYAVLPGLGVMGNYTYSAGFKSRDAWFVFSLYSAETGKPLAVFDGSSMNPWKTGACGGVAIDNLARKDANSIAVFGSGPQALSQLRAAATVRDIQHGYVYSPTSGHREGYAEKMSEELSIDIEPVSQPRDAVQDVDIVVTATDSDTPVFRDKDLEDGVHVNVIGQYHPEKREIEAGTVKRSKYVVDLRERLERDSGEYMLAVRDGVVDSGHFHGELGEVVVGDVSGRVDSGDVTVFDSGGTAIETTAAAYLLYQRCVEEGLGMEVEFMPSSEAMPSVD